MFRPLATQGAIFTRSLPASVFCGDTIDVCQSSAYGLRSITRGKEMG
jgi:hypothetical protein